MTPDEIEHHNAEAEAVAAAAKTMVDATAKAAATVMETARVAAAIQASANVANMRQAPARNLTTWMALAISGISLLSTIYMQVNRSDKDMLQRVTTLEAHQGDTGARLDRIESKVDLLIQGMIRGVQPTQPAFTSTNPR